MQSSINLYHLSIFLPFSLKCWQAILTVFIVRMNFVLFSFTKCYKERETVFAKNHYQKNMLKSKLILFWSMWNFNKVLSVEISNQRLKQKKFIMSYFSLEK